MFNAIATFVERDRGIAANYHGSLRGYARLKLRCDPIYSAAAAVLAEADAPVLDIGCGIGLLGLYLRAQGFNRRYLGIDTDAAKIERARQSAGEHTTLAFENRDAVVLPAFSGSVAILDVLHYLDSERQRALLRAAARRVAPDGVLVVRTALQKPAWRYHLTVWEERLLHACGWMRMPAVHFPRREELESALRDVGMHVTIEPLWGCTPFASFLVVAKRHT